MVFRRLGLKYMTCHAARSETTNKPTICLSNRLTALARTTILLPRLNAPGAIIDCSLLDGGVILIPAFSIGRTQELLFDIENSDLGASTQRRYSHLSSDLPMAEKVTILPTLLKS
ncbi:hypothetical protein O9929_03615 [Vibrio lentus]|nr:hypothetical protein [Vibrio lentus]